MGHWDNTKIGLAVSPKGKELATQFLQIIGADTENIDFYEEIGELSGEYDPTIEGSIADDPFDLMTSMAKLFSDYVDQFYGYDNDDEEFDEDFDEEEESDEDFQDNIELSLDDIFLFANKLFSPAYLYFAHEDGNSVSDSYYRYEVIYDPSTGKKREYNCYYSYGDGINLDFDNDEDPKDVVTEKCEIDIASNELNNTIIDSLIKKAESEGFDELAKRLKTCV